jgi:hypothetical protein
MQTLIKILVAAGMIVAATEVSKRIPRVGGLILSLPLTSIIALAWLYVSERDPGKVAALSVSTFWFVLPSLLLFPVLAALLRYRTPFIAAISISCFVTACAYAGWPVVLGRFGIKL